MHFNIPNMQKPKIKIAAVSISDRASEGVYADQGIPTISKWLIDSLITPFEFVCKLIPDEQMIIEKTLIELADVEKCQLILTTGGTGPSLRDVTPEATINVGEKELPGFGEQMRQISLKFVPTAILSRQTAVIRGKSLIVNLPGQPKAISETLGGLRSSDGQVIVDGLFSAIPYGVELISGVIIQTKPEKIKAFRPKSAPAIK